MKRTLISTSRRFLLNEAMRKRCVRFRTRCEGRAFSAEREATTPIGVKEFRDMLDAIEEMPDSDDIERIAVGVSGGTDSLALCLLLSQWAKSNGKSKELYAFTVDHGLRAESAEEAKRVREWVQNIGFTHVSRTIEWVKDEGKEESSERGGKIPGARLLHASAKANREQILDQLCRETGVRYLMLGHHADDQVETFVQRVMKASGLDGLASMKVARPMVDGGSYFLGCFDPDDPTGVTTVLRPFLRVAKSRLEATCLAHGQSWVQDPSNENLRFDRARIRKTRSLLESEGTPLRTRDVLACVDDVFVSAQDKMRDIMRQLLREGVVRTNDRMNFAVLDLHGIKDFPTTIQIRICRELFHYVTTSSYAPKYNTVRKFVVDALSPHSRKQGSNNSGNGANAYMRLLRMYATNGALAIPWSRDGRFVLFSCESGPSSHVLRRKNASSFETAKDPPFPSAGDDDNVFGRCVWDSRFAVHCRIPRTHASLVEKLQIDRMVPDHWQELCKRYRNLKYEVSLPKTVRFNLPVVYGPCLSEIDATKNRALRQNPRLVWNLGDVCVSKRSDASRRKNLVASSNVVALPHVGWIRPDMAALGMKFHVSQIRRTPPFDDDSETD